MIPAMTALGRGLGPRFSWAPAVPLPDGLGPPSPPPLGMEFVAMVIVTVSVAMDDEPMVAIASC
jgi:hypothetical protein